MTFSFPCKTHFISFSCLTALPKISRTVLERVVKVDIVALLLIVEAVFSCPPLVMMLATDLPGTAFLVLQYIPLYLIY